MTDNAGFDLAQSLYPKLAELTVAATVLAHGPNRQSRDAWLRTAWCAADTAVRLRQRRTAEDLAPLFVLLSLVSRDMDEVLVTVKPNAQDPLALRNRIGEPMRNLIELRQKLEDWPLFVG